jgi:hypothetical protein
LDTTTTHRHAQENGFCLSYVFKVHDLQARGFVRWYGVLFLAPQASLLASTDFLVGFVPLPIISRSGRPCRLTD